MNKIAHHSRAWTSDWVRGWPVTLAAVFSLAGCGGADDSQSSAGVPSARPDQASAAATSLPPDDAEPPANLRGDEERLANAFVTSKTGAPVDLRYEIVPKPAVGQPFELVLALSPRTAADALEVTATGMPGLSVEGGAENRFENVQSGERYDAKVMLRADAEGVFYAGVVVRMIDKLQTQARTFSVPVVVGVPATVEKQSAAATADGPEVRSMPARESVEATPPADAAHPADAGGE